MGSSSTQDSSERNNSTFNSNTSNNASTTAWAPQAAALQRGFDASGNALTQSQAAAGNAPTDYTAQFDPALIGQFNNMLGYANNTNTGALNNVGNSAAANGANGSNAAMNNLLGYDPTKYNNPSTLINQANQYADGQNIDAQVNNSMLNARQTARDVTMPGIEQAAQGSGNANSSRVGIAQGMVERGLAQQATDLGATLRNQAFGQGLQLASNNAQNNNQSMLQATANAGTLGSSLFGQGTNAVNSSIADQGQLFGMGTNAGQGLTAATQAGLTNQQQQYQAGINNPYAALQPYMNLIGSRMYGSNTTSNGINSGNSQTIGTGTKTTQNDPGLLSNISSGIGLLGAFL